MEHHFDAEQEGRPPYEESPKAPHPSSGMASAALVLGIISIVTACCFYISIPLGALAILFAILSKEPSRPYLSQAKSGLVLASIGMAATVLLLALAFAVEVTYLDDQEFREQLEEYMDYFEEEYLPDQEPSDSPDAFRGYEDGIPGDSLPGSDGYYFDYTPYQETPSTEIPKGSV